MRGMRVLCGFLLAALSVSQPYPSPEDCDEGNGRLRFANLRPMEGEPVDIAPFLVIPPDYGVGRAKPMRPVKEGIDTVCPFGEKCNTPKATKPKPQKPTPTSPPAPITAEDVKKSDEVAMDAPVSPQDPKTNVPAENNDPSISPKDWSRPPPLVPKQPEVKDPVTDAGSGSTQEPEKSVSVDMDEPEVNEDEDEQDEEKLGGLSEDEDEPAPVGAGPDGLIPAPRTEGSVSKETMDAEKEIAAAEAVKEALEMALAASPSPDPVPELDNSEIDSEYVVSDPFVQPPTDTGPGAGEKLPPAQENAPPVRFEEPSPSPSQKPSPSPSSSPPWYPEFETEFEDCNDPPELRRDAVLHDEMPVGQYPITALRGQDVPVRSSRFSAALAPTDFEQLPRTLQEQVVDSAHLEAEDVGSYDSSMSDVTKYQTFALQDKYIPNPGMRKSLRRTNLAGGDMGSFEPSLDGLDDITTAASRLAGSILQQESPLKASGEGEEYRAHELSQNVTWALMNEPEIFTPQPTPSPSTSPVPAIPAITPTSPAIPIPSIPEPESDMMATPRFNRTVPSSGHDRVLNPRHMLNKTHSAPSLIPGYYRPAAGVEESPVATDDTAQSGSSSGAVGGSPLPAGDAEVAEPPLPPASEDETEDSVPTPPAATPATPTPTPEDVPYSGGAGSKYQDSTSSGSQPGGPQSSGTVMPPSDEFEDERDVVVPQVPEESRHIYLGDSSVTTVKGVAASLAEGQAMNSGGRLPGGLDAGVEPCEDDKAVLSTGGDSPEVAVMVYGEAEDIVHPAVPQFIPERY